MQGNYLLLQFAFQSQVIFRKTLAMPARQSVLGKFLAFALADGAPPFLLLLLWMMRGMLEHDLRDC
jgi:hypothetical protein